jgi:SecD/SecF fusion protein
MRFSRLTKILIWLAVAVVVVFGVLLGARSLKPDGTLDDLLAWLPKRHASFEQLGGSQLLLEVDKDDLIKSRLETVLADIRTLLRDARVGYKGLGQSGREAHLEIRDPAQVDAAKKALKIFTDPVAGDNPVKEMLLDEPEPGLLRFTLTDDGLKLRTSMALAQSMEVVERRVSDGIGVEPIVKPQGNERILVQVPGLQTPARLTDILGQPGNLTLQMVDTTMPVQDALNGRPPAGSSVLYSQDDPPVPYLVENRVIVSGDNIVNAQATYNSAMNEPVVSFAFDAKGKTRFAEATSQNVGKPFAIILDNQVLSAPIIREPILGGTGQISGNFTKESADDLALLLRSGPMPAKLKIVEVRTIAPGGVQN